MYILVWKSKRRLWEAAIKLWKIAKTHRFHGGG